MYVTHTCMYVALYKGKEVNANRQETWLPPRQWGDPCIAQIPHIPKCARIMKPHLAFCIIVSIGAPRVEAVTEGFTRGELFAICGYMWIEIRYGLLWFCFFQLVSQCYRLESNAKLLSVTIVYKTIDIRQTTACACCVLRTSEISLHQHTCIIPPLELRPHQGRLGYHLFDA